MTYLSTVKSYQALSDMGLGIDQTMFRVLAVAGFIVATVLFAVYALNTATDAAELGWGFVSTAAGLVCLALDGMPLRVGQ